MEHASTMKKQKKTKTKTKTKKNNKKKKTVTEQLLYAYCFRKHTTFP